MKHLITSLTLILLLSVSYLQADNYWVQVATYGNKVADSYFDEAGVKDVSLHLDQNLIYRYYIKDFSERNKAEEARKLAMDRGFKYAKVVDMDEYLKSCKKLCVDGVDLEEKPLIKVIYFDFDKSGLKKEAKKTLDNVSTIMQMVPDVEVKINGHTDAKGSNMYNLKLSQERAKQARSYLMNQQIEKNKIQSDEFGENLPIAMNETDRGEDLPEGRKFNRRVELIITKKGKELSRHEIKQELYATIPQHLWIDNRIIF